MIKNRIDITGYDDFNFFNYRISFYVFPADKLNKELLTRHAIFATEKVLVVFKQFETQKGPLKYKNLTPKMLYTLIKNISTGNIGGRYSRYGCILLPFPDEFEIQETLFSVFKFDTPDKKEIQKITTWIIENNI